MLELDCLGLSPSLITYQLCNMEQVTLPLLASVSSLVNFGWLWELNALIYLKYLKRAQYQQRQNTCWPLLILWGQSHCMVIEQSKIALKVGLTLYGSQQIVMTGMELGGL